MTPAPAPPVRVLELRSVRGTGGGPEKTILLGAARADSARFAVTVCYLRDARDHVFALAGRARELEVDYLEIVERHSFDPGIWPALRRLVAERGIDVVHAHDYKTNLLAWLLARRGGIVPVATVHGWTGNSRRERRLYYPLDKLQLRLFPRLIAVSAEIRRELVRWGVRPDRVTTILNGIDHRAFRRDPAGVSDTRRALGFPEGAFVVGAVGRLERQKRFDLLLEAMAEVRRQRPDVKLLLVGDGSLRGPLEETARRLGLGDACRFAGHRSDVAFLHHAFDLLVQSSDYEGTPNALLEAMALETPVVATDVGGTAELVRNGVDGLLVPPRDGAALAGAILAVRDDPAATARRVAAARRRAESDLSFDARMHAVEAIYADLARRRREARAAAGRPA